MVSLLPWSILLPFIEAASDVQDWTQSEVIDSYKERRCCVERSGKSPCSFIGRKTRAGSFKQAWLPRIVCDVPVMHSSSTSELASKGLLSVKLVSLLVPAYVIFLRGGVIMSGATQGAKTS